VKRSALTPTDLRALLDAAMVREGIPALAKRAGVSQSYLRALDSVPCDAVLTALGVERVVQYRLQATDVIEQGKA